MAFDDHSELELRKMYQQAQSAENAARERKYALMDELRTRAVGSLQVGDLVVGDNYSACHRFKEPVDSHQPGEFRGLCGRKSIVGVTPSAERSYVYQCRACEKKYLAPSPTPGERA